MNPEPQDPRPGNPVSWFEIYVEDIQRAKAFYEGVFRTKLEKIEAPGIEMWAFAGDDQAYGAHGALVQAPGVKVGQNSLLVYFACQDCAEEEQRVLAFGGKIRRPKLSIGGFGFVSLVVDTEGNLIGLHSFG